MKIQYNGSSKILKRLVELVNRSQNIALRQDNTDKNTLYWTGLDGVEITVNIPSGAVEVDTELSETSTNPVENQAITKELAQKADKSAIPTVGDGVLSVQRNGKIVGTFSANAEENASINIPVPEKVSELENDAGYGTYTKPTTGIPKSDLASGVQASLGKADTALQKHQDISGKLDKTGDASNTTVAFSAASAREDVKTGEKLSVIVGKIAKWFADLKTVAFTGSYNDLANKPTIPDVSGKQDKSTAVTHTANTAVGSATKPVYVAANGAATAIAHSINSDVPANAKFTDTTYPIKWVTIDANFAAEFRTETKGDTAAGGFLSGLRCDTANVTGAPQYGSGIAWGKADTHGYLYVMYSKAEAYLGGGNADRLQWIKQISFDGHTHRDLDQIGNVGYYGSNEANTNGWYKIYSGKLTGFNDHVARLSVVRGLGYGHGTALVHLRCNNNSSIVVQDLVWETRYNFSPDHIAIKTNGNEYGIYVYQAVRQYGRIKVRVLESCGTSSNWTMTLSSNSTKESSFTPTATAKDGGTVAKAKEADTLTDSGWVAMTVEGYAKSGTVKYRTYGKQITITGSVVLKNDIATSYPAPQYIASTTFDFSKIVGCSGVGRSSSGVGAYVAVENYNGDNLVCVYALGSKIAAGSTLYFTITGFID